MTPEMVPDVMILISAILVGIFLRRYGKLLFLSAFIAACVAVYALLSQSIAQSDWYTADIRGQDTESFQEFMGGGR